MTIAIINSATVLFAGLIAFCEDGRPFRTITSLLHCSPRTRFVLFTGFTLSIITAIGQLSRPHAPAAIALGLTAVSLRDSGPVHDAGAFLGFAGMFATAAELFEAQWRDWLGWIAFCMALCGVALYLRKPVMLELGLFAGVHVPLIASATPNSALGSEQDSRELFCRIDAKTMVA